VRLVLDTDVIVAAMRSPRGASAELLRRIDRGYATMVLSVALALEYEATCMLAEHILAAGLGESEVVTFLDGLVDMAEKVTPRYRWRPQLRDPGDELVLEAAVNGQAVAIVTFNRRDFPMVRARFGIEVLLPAEAIRRI
jgi:putative PIN family toxin of toxin-antitoxin system